MVLVQVIPEADFDRDGSYETDLSSFLTQRAGGLVISRGAAKQGALGEGTLQLNLDNYDGTFTIEYSGSSLYGQMETGVPLRVRCRLNGADYAMFTGYVSRYQPRFGRVGENRCAVEAKDLVAQLGKFPLANLVVQEGVTTGAAIERLGDYLGIGSIVDVDEGREEMPIHYARNANALVHLMDVVRSEMGGEAFVDADGVLRFLERAARIGSDADREWGTGTGIEPEVVEPELTDDDLITSCAVQANMFLLENQEVVVFTFSRNARNPVPDSLFLAAGVPYEAELDFGAPMTALVEPEAFVDYTANASIDGTGADATNDLAVTITDRGAGFRLSLVSASDLYVTWFQLRGLPADFVVDRPVFTHALSIAGAVMDEGVTLQVPFTEDTQRPRDYPVGVCRTYRYGYPFVRLNFAWDTEDIAREMLEVELWDQVYFEDTGPGGAEFLTHIAEHFYVVGIQHRLQPGAVERTLVTLVPSYLYFDVEQVVTDGFDRADATGALGTAISGDAWSGDSAMDITSGRARASSDSAQTPTLSLFESEDQVVEVQLTNIAAGDEVGVVFRFASATDYSRAYVDKGSNEVVLEHVIGGAATEVASPAYTVGTSAEMRVMVQGHRVRVWVDRRLYIDEEDPLAWLGARVGLFARNASGSTTFDNFHGRGI